MRERFSGDQPYALTSAEKANLEHALRMRGGVHKAEGFHDEEPHATQVESVHSVLTKAHEQMNKPTGIRRLLPRKQKAEEAPTESTEITKGHIAKIAGITLLSAAAGAVLAEAMVVVFIGASIADSFFWMGLVGVLGGIVGFRESAQAILPKNIWQNKEN